MRLGAFLAVFALVTGCFADYVPPMPAYMAGAAPGRSFNADAPPGFDPRLLGVPRDANFHAAPGVGSLFPQAGPLVPVPVNRFNVDQKLVSTAEELAANAQAWAVDFNLSSLRRQRYAYFRPVPWTTAWELQPGGSMLQPPPWAVYYASKVYLGRSYVEIIEGDASIFDARAGMQFLQAPVGASISQYASDHHLTSHRAGTGFVPVGAGSMFARTEQDILQNYRPDGPEIAVAIEYTQLPRTQPNGALLFPDPKTVTVRFVSLDVGAPGAMFTDASTWTMTGDCTVNGQSDAGPQRFLAERVRLGQFPLTFMRTVVAADGDQLVCSAQGTYSRGLGGEPHSLGPSTNWDGAFNDNERPKGLLCDRGGFRVSSSADKLCAAYSQARAQCGSSARWDLCGGRPEPKGKGRPYRDRPGGRPARRLARAHLNGPAWRALGRFDASDELEKSFGQLLGCLHRNVVTDAIELD